MTAIADLTTLVTLLRGAAPTNAQLQRVADGFAEYVQVRNPTNEQRAQAALIGIRRMLIQRLREQAEGAVYSAVIRQPHKAADQPALLRAVESDARAAGDAAEGDI